MCFDQIYYGAMPGKANYCLAMRDWHAGHYDSGLVLLKLAAGWGNKNAQYTLGLIYYNGHHVALNRPLGIAWLELANQRHDDARIAAVTKSAVKWATPADRARAELLYTQLSSTYGDKVATARAWHRLRHWQKSHNRHNKGCAYLYGPQGEAALAAGVGVVLLHGKSKHRQFLVCVALRTKHHLVEKAATTYFHGWMGTVSVGPLSPAPAPAASAER